MSLNTKWLFCTSVFLLLLLSARQTADAYFLTEDSVEEWRGQRDDETVPNQNAACDSTLNMTGSSGHLVSYNFPNNYANNLFCTWYIKADPLPNDADKSIISVKFESFALEAQSTCNYDYLSFYIGTSANSEQLVRKVCGLNKPSEVIINGLAAFVVFRTDGSNTYSGFHGTWEVVHEDTAVVPNQNQACTNAPLMLSGTDGHVVSWNYPNNYANNLRCAWKITATENPNFNSTGIKLTAEDFVLEASSCRYDYLTISYGPDTELVEVGKYCGQSIPDIIIGYDRQMSLEFITDSSQTFRGFHFRWTTVDIGDMLIQNGACLRDSRPLLLNGMEGEIVSWNYPGPYLSNINCAWQIMADTTSEQSVVKLTFDTIKIHASTKCTTDSVTIYDSISNSSKVLGHFCGSTKPSPVFSTGKDMFVTFKSGSTVSSSNTGFRILWSISEPGNEIAANHTEACTDGPLMLAGNDGEFFSWNYPGNYENFLHCSWEITGVDVDKVIQLTFVDFLTETPCTTDYLTVYIRDETNDDWEEYKTFCGSKTNTKVVGSSSRMLVNFDTDFNVVNRGFHIKWEMVDWSFFIPNQNHACSSTQTPLELTGHEGHIVSYNYPDNYASNLNCAWKIEATVLNTTFERPGVELTVQDFQLESHSTCRYDYLTVFDGPSPLSPNVGTYCGTSAPQKMLIHGIDAYLQFRTDGSQNFRGFHITWKIIDTADIINQNDACRNGSLMQSGTSGDIVSWNYPNAYASNLECSWKIVADTDNVKSAIKLTFESFDIDGDKKCVKDALSIYDGDTFLPGSQTEATQQQLLAHVCGSAIPLPVVSSGNKMDVTFKSGSHVGNVHSGFHLTWNISEPEDITVTGNHTEACKRGVVMSGVGGDIFSWNYPGDYINNLRCTWQITGDDEEEVIRLIFVDFATESPCTTDYLTVYDNYTSEGGGEEVRRFCGTSKPRDVIATTNRVLVTFTTDHTITNRGFHLRWESVDENDYTIPPYNGQCGIQQIPHKPGNGRVVGGQAATVGSWPWQVDMQLSSGRHYCGGNLIHPQWVLSAAHCFTSNPSPSSWRAILGKHNKNTEDDTEQKMIVEKVFRHEQYGSLTRFDSDYALLKLETPVTVTDYASPICLPIKDSVVANGTMCYTTGWGSTHGTGNDNVLKQAIVPVVDRATCNKPALYNGQITDTMICAGFIEEGGHDACQGDSGGPFVCARKNADGTESNIWEVSGIVSWGNGCAQRYKPGVYSRTASAVEWIENLMKFE